MRDSFEDKVVERDLDMLAKVQFDLLYELGETISEGAEGVIYEVFKDGKTFAAKRRRNPASNKSLNYEGRLRVYQTYLKEIDYLSHCNHVNIVKFEEALRDKLGNLYIILEMCDDVLYHKRDLDLGENKFYDERIIINILKQIC